MTVRKLAILLNFIVQTLVILNVKYVKLINKIVYYVKDNLGSKKSI